MSSVVLMILYIEVSSTYNFTWDETIEGRSLMYNKNKNDPKTEYWGTPDTILIDLLVILCLAQLAVLC